MAEEEENICTCWQDEKFLPSENVGIYKKNLIMKTCDVTFRYQKLIKTFENEMKGKMRKRTKVLKIKYKIKRLNIFIISGTLSTSIHFLYRLHGDFFDEAMEVINEMQSKNARVNPYVKTNTCSCSWIKLLKTI